MLLSLFNILKNLGTKKTLRKLNVEGVLNSKQFITGNPYLPSGLLHPFQLDKSISSFRGVWVYFFILILFQIEIPATKQCRP